MKLHDIIGLRGLRSNLPAEEFYRKFESTTVADTLKHLELIMPSLYERFQFIVLFNNGHRVRQWDITNDGKSDLRRVFMIFDEMGRVPFELLRSATNIVFHAYLSFPENRKPAPNVFHFPLGCNASVPQLPYVLPQERPVSVFFSGNFHRGRAAMLRTLTGYYGLPTFVLGRLHNIHSFQFDHLFKNGYVRFTNGFASGLTPEAYGLFLSTSRIVLSPPGISNLECFRHYEALRAGCVVIAEKLPTKPHYLDSPIIALGSWRRNFQFVRKLMDDEAQLAELSKKSYQWYEEKLSPPATATFMKKSIEAL
jgi:hypothetical protein